MQVSVYFIGFTNFLNCYSPLSHSLKFYIIFPPFPAPSLPFVQKNWGFHEVVWSICWVINALIINYNQQYNQGGVYYIIKGEFTDQQAPLYSILFKLLMLSTIGKELSLCHKNSYFLIPISLQPNVVYLRYFKMLK